MRLKISYTGVLAKHSTWLNNRNTTITKCLSSANLPVFQVCLGALLCQGNRVVQHALERVLEWCQMLTGWVRGDQEVREALAGQEDPVRKKVLMFFFFPLCKWNRMSHLSLRPYCNPDEFSVTVQVFKPRAQGICSILQHRYTQSLHCMLWYKNKHSKT